MLSPAEWSALWLSIKATTVSLLLMLPVGVGIGWTISRTRWRWRGLLNALVHLPLVLPPVVTGYVLLILFGREGPFGRLFEAVGLPIAFTWRAVVLAIGAVAMPLLVRGVVLAMDAVDPRLEVAARTLGASRWRVFWTITLPLSYRGVLAGGILAFARGLGEFGATVIVAGNIPGRTQTVPLAIFNRIQVGAEAEALRLVLIAAIVSLLAVWASERLMPGYLRRQ
ncbi:MAG: molybdate ABC transporter permease [Candidatus Poribacteria bacterium]|nr:MAG: molybdate ABC transporter permease [Candidatus Poribacteria bacterium]